MRTYLALCRFPAVFTAAADIFLGYSLVANPTFSVRFALGLLCSAGLYLGGMVLNDILDEVKDRQERPTRPIPSGRVSSQQAWGFYGGLTSVGLVAAIACNVGVTVVALALVAMVWLYDGPLKKTAAGPVAMGLCRSGNILLGASAAAGVPTALDWTANEWTAFDWRAVTDARVVSIALAMGTYICGLTWFARQEAGEPKRSGLIIGWLIINLGLASAVAWAGVSCSDPASYGVFVAFAVIAALINRRLLLAIRKPQPSHIQPAIRTMLLAIPVWNACLMIAFLGPSVAIWSAATAALVIPAAMIGRILKLT